MSTAAELFERLGGDRWRLTNAFSDDILKANALLHNDAATEEEMGEGLFEWCQYQQPCQFGKAAAKQKRIHLCVIRESALRRWSDSEIAEKISEERRLWKQRAACDAQRGAHSFVLVVASPHVAFAAPDRNLQAFSEKMLELSGWDTDRHSARKRNSVASDYLYLRNPTDGAFYGFQFNVDFFACAADGRWWRDHRFPGGIAFTANSTGHMMRFRNWYQHKDQNETWALKQAMLTILNAAPTTDSESHNPEAQGRATWLRPLDQGGRPLLSDVRCPIERVPEVLSGMDWTRYEGTLHTDHAVREEFFQDREHAPTASKPYLMDFTYLYDESRSDFVDFSQGRPFDDATVYEEIGRPEEWVHRASAEASTRSEAEAVFVAEQLRECQSWRNVSWHEPDEDLD